MNSHRKSNKTIFIIDWVNVQPRSASPLKLIKTTSLSTKSLGRIIVLRSRPLSEQRTKISARTISTVASRQVLQPSSRLTEASVTMVRLP